MLKLSTMTWIRFGFGCSSVSHISLNLSLLSLYSLHSIMIWFCVHLISSIVFLNVFLCLKHILCDYYWFCWLYYTIPIHTFPIGLSIYVLYGIWNSNERIDRKIIRLSNMKLKTILLPWILSKTSHSYYKNFYEIFKIQFKTNGFSNILHYIP